MTVFEFVSFDVTGKVMEYIKEHGQATPLEISENLDLSIARTYRILKSEYHRKNLERKEVFYDVDGVPKHRHLVYSIPERRHKHGKI